MVARLLYGERLWEEIDRLAHGSRSLTAAVAFVGARSDRLFKWPRDVTLVADLSEAQVREGASYARGALRLLRKGIRVSEYSSLHAKVLLFDKRAVIGSMNLSEESRHRLEEAAVVVRARKEVESVRRYVRRLLNDATPLSEEVLRARARREPRRVPRRPVRPKKARSAHLADRVWLLPTGQDHEETPAERRRARQEARRLVQEHGIPDERELVWYFQCGADIYRRARGGDWCFCWWRSEKHRPLGSFEGPYRVVQPVDLGARFRERR